jgi:hypothetical protein
MSGFKLYPRNPFLYIYLNWHSEFLGSHEADVKRIFPYTKDSHYQVVVKVNVAL